MSSSGALHEKTPFGVHLDNASAFMFTIDGAKRMLAWPGDYPGITGRTMDYAGIRPDAELLDAPSGSMIYWPSGAWHVGESPEPSASLQVTLYFDGDPLEVVVDEARALEDGARLARPVPDVSVRHRRDRRRGFHPRWQPRARRWPPSFAAGRLDDKLTERWLMFRSAYGFGPFPSRTRPARRARRSCAQQRALPDPARRAVGRDPLPRRQRALRAGGANTSDHGAPAPPRRRRGDRRGRRRLAANRPS